MAHCNKCNDGINDDTRLRCDYCDGLGNCPDEDAIPLDDEEPWHPCSHCDGHDACVDFGCAMQLLNME